MAPVFARQPTMLPRVLIVATGGTIAATGASSTDLTNYRSAALLGEQVLNSVPEVKQYAEVTDELKRLSALTSRS